MIKKSAVKNLMQKEFKKKIGEKAFQKLDNLSKEFIKDVLKKASRKADISGRIIIKEQDVN